MRSFRKAQSVLEYSLLIAVIVGAAITMQVYLKRSMQGQIQLTTDQLAEQYAPEQTRLHEHFESNVRTTDWALPYPYNINNVRGNFRAEAHRELEPLPNH